MDVDEHNGTPYSSNFGVLAAVRKKERRLRQPMSRHGWLDLVDFNTFTQFTTISMFLSPKNRHRKNVKAAETSFRFSMLVN
jgi:hypothetical protein